MTFLSSAEIQDALRPISSLISKSEKAQAKLTPGTWQHSMLRDNLKALNIAHELMSKTGNQTDRWKPDDLHESLRTLDSMIARTANTRTRFAPGTSQHTLQKNRLHALQIAKELIRMMGEKT